MTSTSRRRQLAQQAHRGSRSRRELFLDLYYYAVGAAMLVVLAALAFALAWRFFAVAAHGDTPAWEVLPIPDTPGGRILLLVVVMACVGGLLVRELIGGHEELRLRMDDTGTVAVPAAALEELLDERLGRHPDVVRVETRIEAREGALHAEVAAALRPLAKRDAVGEELLVSVRSALFVTTGLPQAEPRLRLRVLRAGELARQL